MFDHFNLLQMNNYLNLLNLLLTLSCFLKHRLTIYYYYFSQTCFGKEGVELKVSQLKWLVHTSITTNEPFQNQLILCFMHA